METIKNLETLSDSELAQLDEDGINQLIEVECAIAGAQISPEEPVRPEPIRVESDLKLVTVKEFTVEPEVAQQIQELLEKVNVWYKAGYGEKESWKVIPSSDYSYPTFQNVHVLSELARAAQATETIIKQKLWDEYNELMDGFKEAVEKRDQVIETVSERVAKARSEQWKIERRTQEWERYQKLANNDFDIARKFFCDRYSPAELDAILEVA